MIVKFIRLLLWIVGGEKKVKVCQKYEGLFNSEYGWIQSSWWNILLNDSHCMCRLYYLSCYLLLATCCFCWQCRSKVYTYAAGFTLFSHLNFMLDR